MKNVIFNLEIEIAVSSLTSHYKVDYKVTSLFCSAVRMYSEVFIPYKGVFLM